MCPALLNDSKGIGVFFNVTYRVRHLLANLGLVDLDLCCSTLCLVLSGLMGNWQTWLSS